MRRGRINDALKKRKPTEEKKEIKKPPAKPIKPKNTGKADQENESKEIL